MRFDKNVLHNNMFDVEEQFSLHNKYFEGEVVVAQLEERLLLITEIRGSNPIMGKKLFILNICLLSTVYWKDENKEKEAGNGPFF